MPGDALNQVFAAAGRPRVGGEIADCPFQIGPGVQRDPENDFGPLTGGLLMPLLRLVSLQEGELYRGAAPPAGRCTGWGRPPETSARGLAPPGGRPRASQPGVEGRAGRGALNRAGRGHGPLWKASSRRPGLMLATSDSLQARETRSARSMERKAAQGCCGETMKFEATEGLRGRLVQELFRTWGSGSLQTLLVSSS